MRRESPTRSKKECMHHHIPLPRYESSVSARFVLSFVCASIPSRTSDYGPKSHFGRSEFCHSCIFVPRFSAFCGLGADFHHLAEVYPPLLRTASTETKSSLRGRRPLPHAWESANNMRVHAMNATTMQRRRSARSMAGESTRWSTGHLRRERHNAGATVDGTARPAS
jgi:hypothetical protein